jgi:hypothetical protein
MGAATNDALDLPGARSQSRSLRLHVGRLICVSTTVRISDQTHARLAAIAEETGQRMQTILDEAITAYDDSRFWDEFTSGYEQLASDPDTWVEIEQERGSEVASLTDDIDSDT